jgi:hypothetical protein
VSTRRKYRTPADRTPADLNVAVAPELGLSAAPEPAPEENPLQRAYKAQRHAEELQRQHAHRQQIGLPEPPIDPHQRQAIDAHIDSIHGLTDHQKRFLKSHPSLLHEPYLSLMQHAVMIARHARIAEDTPAFDQAILSGIAKDIEHHRALSAMTSADARPTPENAQMHQETEQGAADLMREADEHHAAWLAENPPPPPPQRKRSIPMSAPVSRDVAGVSGQRIDSGNTLRADERQIARVSFPHLSPPQAEYAYLQNKKRMIAMKADGRIQGDG